jgi:hypothetical protein
LPILVLPDVARHSRIARHGSSMAQDVTAEEAFRGPERVIVELAEQIG